MAIEPRNSSANRLYRVYIQPSELVAVWAGGCDDVKLYLGAAAGLIGGLIATAMNPMKHKTTRQEELDSMPLELLRDDHRHNFAVGFDDVENAEVVAPSLWFKLNHATVPQFGLLRLRCRERGLTTLALCSPLDVRCVLERLPARLGDRLRVGLEWDPCDRNSH
jgi:hypothetical protein